MEKPSGHKGGPESDYFRFDPEAKNYLKVSDALLSIEAIGDGFGSEFTASLLVDEWNNESRQNPRKSLGLGQRP